MSVVGETLSSKKSRECQVGIVRRAESAGRCALAESRDGTDWCYSLFGLRVWSAIELPLPCEPWSADLAVDCVVRRAPDGAVAVPVAPVIATKFRDDGTVQAVRHHGSQGDWIWNREIGTIYFSADGAVVEVFPEPEADDRLLAMMVMGQVGVFLLHQRGIPCLHASAVRTHAGSAAFVGTHGQGKSTMAACFLRRGAELLTDDVLPLCLGQDRVLAGPSLPVMKMWPETVIEALDVRETLPNLLRGLDKKLLEVGDRYPMVRSATRLDAIYVLYRYDTVAAGEETLRIRLLNPREALTMLLSQTSWNGLYSPAELARLMSVYAQMAAQTSVRLLSFPNGFAYHDRVYAGVVQDLESL